VILQILAITLQPEQLTVEYNEDVSTGRATCENGLPISQSMVYYGYYLFLLLIIVLVVMAHATSELPSLFNESKVIFESTLVSLLLLVLGLGVILVTRSPTTSPNVEYFVMVLLVLSLTLSMSLRIMLPKLRMVWRNETVLVSKLVSDHVRARRSTTGEGAASGEYDGRISGLVNPLQQQQSTDPNQSTQSTEYRPRPRSRVSTEGTGRSDSMDVMDELYDFEESTNYDDTSHGEDVQQQNNKDKRLRSNPNTLRNRRRESSRRPIIVKREETPARRLVLKMVDLQEHLAAVNERIMSGLAVSDDDWVSLRRLSGRLGDSFRDEVKFSWEEDEKDDNIEVGNSNNGLSPDSIPEENAADLDDGSDSQPLAQRRPEDRTVTTTTAGSSGDLIPAAADANGERLEV